MRRAFHIPRAVLIAAAVALPATAGACATHRYYDPDDRMYHRWNHQESVFYERWEFETHRPHMDFNRRNDDDRAAYWRWRQEHRDDHRDRDRDRD